MVRVRKNDILEKNRQGKKGLGLGLVYPCAEAIEIAGLMGGFDYVNLDGEHGAFTSDSIEAMCRVADGYGLTVTARVPNLDHSVINAYMDRGVIGILGPHIDTADDARSLVNACRYTPDGERSWGGGRGTFYNSSALLDVTGGERTEFMALTNKEILVMGQLETTTSFNNLDSILEVEGLDVFAWGPNDLAQDLGYPGQPQHPAVLEAQAKVEERIHAAGRKVITDVVAQINLPTLIVEGARKFLADNQ